MAFLKLPAIIADLGIGYLLYRFSSMRHSREGGESPRYSGGNPSNLPLILSSLYLFNPAVIYVSSVWGQIESITIFFLLLSLYQILLSANKNRYLSILVFVIAALTKQTALWFLPFYIFLWYKELKPREWILGGLSGLSLFFLSYLPFGLTPFLAIKNYFSTLSGSSTVVSDAAWNLWYFLVPMRTEDSLHLGLYSIRQLSIILLVITLFILLMKLYKKYTISHFLNLLFIWSLAVFFLQTRVHERHLAFALVFLLLTPGIKLRYFLDYFALSLFHFANLFMVLRLPFF